MVKRLGAWLHTRPDGVPFLWSTLVAAVLLFVFAGPPEGEAWLDWSPSEPFLRMSQTVDAP